MGEKLPWMPFYGFDFYGDDHVQQMSWYEQAIYLRLLWEQWVHGSLPADTGALRRIAKPDMAELAIAPFGCWDDETVLWMLDDCFPVGDDDRRRNPKLERVRTAHMGAHKARVKAAKDTNRKRRQRKTIDGDRDAKRIGDRDGDRGENQNQNQNQNQITTSVSNETGANAPDRDPPFRDGKPNGAYWAPVLRRAAVDESHIGDTIKNWIPRALRDAAHVELIAFLEAEGLRRATGGHAPWNPAAAWNLKNDDCALSFRYQLNQWRKAQPAGRVARTVGLR